MIYTESFSVPVDARAVFDALLDEALLTQWLAEHVRIEPQKGGAYRFWGRDVLWCADEEAGRGEILELDVPRTLVFSWRWKGHDSRVSIRVAEEGAIRTPTQP